MAKLKVSDVFKKDLKVVGYCLVFGLGSWLSKQLGASPELALVFGGALDFIVFRAEQELTKQGYREALK